MEQGQETAGNPRKKRLFPVCVAGVLAAVIFVLCALTLAGLAHWYHRNQAVREQVAQAEVWARLLNHGFLERLRGAVGAIASLAPVRKVAAGEIKPDNERVVLILETTRRNLNADMSFVMNATGCVVACAQLGKEPWLIGQDMDETPFFQQAMKGDLYLWFLAGPNTNLAPGIYVSAPVYEDNGKTPIGVVALKAPLDHLAEALHLLPHEAAIVSPEGVALLAKNPQWTFHLTHGLTAEAQQRARHRYGPESLMGCVPHPAFLRPGAPEAHWYLVTRKHLAIFSPENEAWHVLTVRDIRKGYPAIYWIGSIALSAALTLLLLSWWRKRREASPPADEEKDAEMLPDLVLYSVSEAVMATDHQGRVSYINPASERLTGWPSSEALGTPLVDVLCILDPQTGMPTPNPLPETLASGRPQRMATPLLLVARDGQRRVVQINMTPVWSTREKGILVGVAVAISDVSERHEDYEKLRQSEELYRTLLDHMPGAVFRCSSVVPWTMLFVSRDIVRLCGYEAEELMDNKVVSYAGIIHPDDRSLVERHVQDELTGRSSYSVEYRLLHRDGSIRWARETGRGVYDAQGELIAIDGVISDISDRRELDEVMEQQAELQQVILQLAMSFVNVPLDLLDRAIQDAMGSIGVFVGANRAYLCSYDFERGLLKRTHTWKAQEDDLLPADNWPEKIGQLPSYWKEAHRKGEPVHISDISELAENDSLRLLLEPAQVKSLIALPLRNDEDCFGFIGFDSPVKREWSEMETMLLQVLAELLVNAEMRRRHEGELMQAREAAEAASKAKSQFLANMSHELRTPMNGVLGMLGLLLEAPLGEEPKRFAHLARQSADHLLVLLNDILDFAKIEAGQLELDSVEFNPVHLMEGVVETLGGTARDKGLSMNSWVDPKVPGLLLGDSARLRQIIVNLAGNAVKFTEKGGVTLRLLRETENQRSVLLRCEVRDTGIGIPPDKIEQLFSPFMQADGSLTRKYGGTGLGLVICKQLVRLMGGEIGVESRPEEGSLFWFMVRLNKPETVSPAIPATAAPIPPPGFPQPPDARKKILVAEDNPINQMVAMGVLARLGYQAITAGNGKEALAKLDEEHDLCAILMDVQMPEMDGIEATRRLRELEQKEGRTRLPVFAMTANAMAGDREACLAAGMDDYVAKPVQYEVLEQLLAKWFAKR